MSLPPVPPMPHPEPGHAVTLITSPRRWDRYTRCCWGYRLSVGCIFRKKEIERFVCVGEQIGICVCVRGGRICLLSFAHCVVGHHVRSTFDPPPASLFVRSLLCIQSNVFLPVGSFFFICGVFLGFQLRLRTNRACVCARDCRCECVREDIPPGSQLFRHIKFPYLRFQPSSSFFFNKQSLICTVTSSTLSVSSKNQTPTTNKKSQIFFLLQHPTILNSYPKS